MTLNLRGSGGFVRHSWVPAVLFSRGKYDIDKVVAPGGVKEGYTSTKILAQGGIANDLYDLYSIPSLLMSWCMFWWMSLK